MTTIAIFSADPALRRRLEQCLRSGRAAKVDVADDPESLTRMLEHGQVDLVVADASPVENWVGWRNGSSDTAFVALVGDVDPTEGLDALHAGAQAILPRSADDAEIIATIEAATRGLTVLPGELLALLMDALSPPGAARRNGDEGQVALTPRELEVLGAMADGASNKTIARRLGISFHTAKFHVAAILMKLDADSRTEAVAKAAHLGLVML